MTVEEAYELAKKQRPGVVIVVGAHGASERMMKPLGYHEAKALRQMPGPLDFLEYRLGFAVSLWARWAALLLAIVAGRSASDDEYAWLMKPGTSLGDVREWLERERATHQRDVMVPA